MSKIRKATKSEPKAFDRCVARAAERVFDRLYDALATKKVHPKTLDRPATPAGKIGLREGLAEALASQFWQHNHAELQGEIDALGEAIVRHWELGTESMSFITARRPKPDVLAEPVPIRSVLARRRVRASAQRGPARRRSDGCTLQRHAA